MDLVAYLQIGYLQHIANENEIYVDRLRGYRLMKDESPMTADDIEDWKQGVYREAVDDAICGHPMYSINPRYYICTSRTIKKVKKMINKDGTVKMNMIHGKMRKCVKYIVKKKMRLAEHQYAAWNRYAGKSDVLYIHSRDARHLNEYRSKPWFLDACVDWFDSTYCDIYAKIQEVKHD